MSPAAPVVTQDAAELEPDGGEDAAVMDVPPHGVEIQAILGHAEITTTMRYVHSIPDSQRQAARKMDDALWGSGPA